MIILNLAGPVLANTSSDDNWGLIGLVFFLSGFVFYAAIFLRYRNADKRFKHESQTRSEMKNLRVRDDLVKSQKGLSNSSMRGANNRQVTGSLNSLSKLTGMAGGDVQRLMDQVNRFRPRG